MTYNMLDNTGDKRKKNARIFILLAVLIAVIVPYLIQPTGKKTESEEVKAETEKTGSLLPPDQKKHLDSLELAGSIQFNPETVTVFIEPGIWDEMDHQDKEKFAGSCALFLAEKRGSSQVWCDIYDKQTGKRLANYSRDSSKYFR